MLRKASFAFVVSLTALTLLSACPQASGAGPANTGRGGTGGGRGGGGGGGGTPEPDQCSAVTNKPLLGAGAVYFGTRSPSHVQLNASQMRAVVGVGQGRGFGSVCSGTLITDTVVLTATHCTEGSRADSFFVNFGVDDENPELVIDVVEKTEHPDLDIAMLRLASSPIGRIDVTPIPAFAGTLLASDAGEIFEQAGYGQTETGSSNGRFFVAEPFAGFEQGGYLKVNGEGRHGVCFGDSGGPSLRQTAEGDVRVMGALSWGDESCTGTDRYTRVDLARDWIVGFAGPIPAPGSAVPGCGSITSAGQCSPDGTTAQFCQNGGLVQTACASDEVCGDGAGGKRCIAAADDPCGGVTSFGECGGNVLQWCDGGVVRTRDCGGCGDQTCSLVDNVTGFACVDDPCGGLDFLGECDGTLARWCEDGQIKENECADTGNTCGFVDADTGYFCQ